jgi:hypothetical protein
MALLAWEDVSWAGFVAGLEGFRDHFTTDPANRAYADFLDLQKGPDYARELVRLLNRWACRLSSARAPAALEEWLRAHAADLGEVERLTILDARVRDHAEELGALHDDLIASMRATRRPPRPCICSARGSSSCGTRRSAALPRRDTAPIS